MTVNWDYSTEHDVNMWTWTPKHGVRYRVTQFNGAITAHLTTGTAHKFVRSIGTYATVNEARQRCLDHWQNSDYATGG